MMAQRPRRRSGPNSQAALITKQRSHMQRSFGEVLEFDMHLVLSIYTMNIGSILASSKELFHPNTSLRCRSIVGVGFLRGLPALGGFIKRTSPSSRAYMLSRILLVRRRFVCGSRITLCGCLRWSGGCRHVRDPQALGLACALSVIEWVARSSLSLNRLGCRIRGGLGRPGSACSLATCSLHDCRVGAFESCTFVGATGALVCFAGRPLLLLRGRACRLW